jgi:predicted acyltransferase
LKEGNGKYYFVPLQNFWIEPPVFKGQNIPMSNATLSVSDVPRSATVASVPVPTQRLMSLDALRGFDMFWIIGAEELVSALDKMAHPKGEGTGFSIIGFVDGQLKHCDWAGFHFEDLIFPLFVFMVGVSLVFSLTKTIRQEGRTVAVKRIFRRGILLFALGLFYSGGFTNNWPDMRLMGVLNRIALCYFFAGLIFCFCNVRAMIAISVGLLVGYWALVTFVPIRNIQLEKTALDQLAKERGVPDDPKALFDATTDRGTRHYEHGFNLPNHFDFQYLPGRKYDTYFDPEGYLSTFPAIVSCLLGVFAGLLLANSSFKDQQKVIWLIAAGVILLNLGLIWGLQFPVIKKIWTSSFVLVAGGCSALLLGIFYLIIDVWKFQKWCQPFVWMGMNSITIYMTVNILGKGGFSRLSARLVGGDIRDFFNARWTGSGELLIAVVGLLMAFWLMHFLYRRKVFLRL